MQPTYFVKHPDGSYSEADPQPIAEKSEIVPMTMQYATEYNSNGGFRFDVRNPPPAGTKLKTNRGEAVVFDEVGIAGMLACTRTSDGSQQLYFPHDLDIQDGDGVTSDIGAGSGD